MILEVIIVCITIIFSVALYCITLKNLGKPENHYNIYINGSAANQDQPIHSVSAQPYDSKEKSSPIRFDEDLIKLHMTRLESNDLGDAEIAVSSQSTSSDSTNDKVNALKNMIRN
jgi:hypothetical protein